MSDVLVRGLPRAVHVKIQKLAASENLSVNQVLIRLIDEGLKNKKKDETEEAEHAFLFRQIRELREEMHHQYGKQEDSAKIIRELQNKRNR